MAEETLRRNLMRAFDAGPEFPHPLLLSRTMAAVQAADVPVRPRRQIRYQLRRRTLRLVAVVVVIAVAAVSTGLFVAINRYAHRAVPVHQQHGVPTAKPISVAPPTAMDCPANCATGTLTAASANVLWAIVEPRAAGPANIYRSADGGQTWHAQASWYNREPFSAIERMTVSADGKQALFVSEVGQTVFHTEDGGAHWASYGLPTTAGSAPSYQTFFLNPQVGWAVAPDATPQVDDLFHTSDGGAQWTLSGRVLTKSGFDLLHGQLVFASSSNAWFVPPYTGSPEIASTIYGSTDGGITWQPKSLIPLNMPPEEIKPGRFAPVHAAIADLKFFSGQSGLIEMSEAAACGGGPNGEVFFCYGPGAIAVYSTSDGGAKWSSPRLLQKSEAVDFIDADHWVETGSASHNWPTSDTNDLARTSDAGATWQYIAPSIPGVTDFGLQQIMDRYVSFVDPSNGVAWVNCWGVVMRTSDGGAHWESFALPSKQPIRFGLCTL